MAATLTACGSQGAGRTAPRGRHRQHPSERASSPIPPCASAARPARWRASSGTSCRTTASCSPACRTTTPSHLGASTWRHVAFIERPVALSRQDAGAFSWLIFVGRVQALRARRMPGKLPDRGDHPHRVRQRLRAAGYLQRLRLLRGRVPVRRHRPPRGGRPRLEMHALLRPSEGRHGAGVRQGVPDRFDHVRRPGTIARNRPRPCQPPARTRDERGYLYGADAAQPGTEGLNAFFLLVDKPEVYNLPPNPVVPTKKVRDAWTSFACAALGMIAVAVGAAFATTRTSR